MRKGRKIFCVIKYSISMLMVILRLLSRALVREREKLRKSLIDVSDFSSKKRGSSKG